MIDLHPWTSADAAVLERTVGDPRMMEHLGGVPESAEQIARRHRQYVELRLPEASMFTVRLGDGTVTGSAGFWEHEWAGERVYEAGWMIFPEFAGRGIATQAAIELVRRASACERNRYLHAFPGVTNAASNAVCARAGFVKLGECTVEFPKGRMMRSNDWRFDLYAARGEG
ncbi:MAG: GNAT family N-acetyltransferase [Candidatus Eremiobacteraeota bacterium]|nr:GNAT family N-acetyltransferase [Candidatus Eremiobacteraeota bacterium]